MASTKYRLCKRLNKCAHTRTQAGEHTHTDSHSLGEYMYCDSWQAHLHKIHIELGFLIAKEGDDDDDEAGAEKYATLLALGTCLSPAYLRACVSVCACVFTLVFK